MLVSFLMNLVLLWQKSKYIMWTISLLKYLKNIKQIYSTVCLHAAEQQLPQTTLSG